MSVETPVDWDTFKDKFSGNPQRAFENLTYYLFCHEFHQNKGIRRYYNQPYIETDPIQVDDRLIGFQSKYYESNASLSRNKNELIKAIRGAAGTYPGLTTLYFYINKDFPASSIKNQAKPSYVEDIEREARDLGIEIEWRGPSNIEVMLLDASLTICRNVYFQVDSPLVNCWNCLESHTHDVLKHIKTTIRYKDQDIFLKNNDLNIEEFLHSDDQVLLVDGDAGSGKSALVKHSLEEINDAEVLLAFKSTDLDAGNVRHFMDLHGEMSIAELLDTYKGDNACFLFIDGTEKFFTFDDQETFIDRLKDFLNAGWKVIFTIRTPYKNSFRSFVLHDFDVCEYHVELTNRRDLSELSDKYEFVLPEENKLLDLLCVPFYLSLYLAFAPYEDTEIAGLSLEVFKEKIWDEIIRCNQKQKDNLPARREAALVQAAEEMLRREEYSYEIQASDDCEAFNALEQSGILVRSDDLKYYSFAHDVFEEVTVSHIFSKRYAHYENPEQFFEGIGTSLRARKLFRGWLSEFASEKEHQDFVIELLNEEGTDSVWKNEIMLAVMETPGLEEAFYKIISTPQDISCSRLIQIINLMNTCCRVADFTYKGLGLLTHFRFSQPEGYAWTAVLTYINNCKEEIEWTEELLAAVANILAAWTGNKENAKSETTVAAGELALFLIEKTYEKRGTFYRIENKLKDQIMLALLNSAWMIREQLSRIFQQVIKTGEEAENPSSVPIGMKPARKRTSTAFEKIAEGATSDILHHGMAPEALPELVIRLMNALWLASPGTTEGNYYTDINEKFGLSQDLNYRYKEASAYQTPILNLLETRPQLALKFLIDFTNKAGETYFQSQLNADHGECSIITIHVGETQVEQIASDRLWKMYRGIVGGPNVLASLLMGFEAWLLKKAESESESIDVIGLCRKILMESRNVMLTSVIVSVAEAYPRKMFDIVCDLLRTKEIFWFDSSRCVSEREAQILLPGNDIFKDERRKSNDLPHRKKNLEEIIQNYQTERDEVSEDEYRVLIQKLYDAIDETTEDIATWETDDKYPYYRMDVRHYKNILGEKKFDNGDVVYVSSPDFTVDMIEQSRQRTEQYNEIFKYADLQIWSYHKFNRDNEDLKYDKYADTGFVLSELKKSWTWLNEDGDSCKTVMPDEFNAIAIDSCIPACIYTAVVLLRDNRDRLSLEDVLFCKQILLTLGKMFAEESETAYAPVYIELEAVVCGLLLLMDDDEEAVADDDHLLCLILKLALKDRSENSHVIKQISSQIWGKNVSNGWRFILIFSQLENRYEQIAKEESELSLDDFLTENSEVVAEALKKDSVSIQDIDFNQLSVEVVFTILPMIPVTLEDAFTAVQLTKDIAMVTAFSNINDQENYDRYLGGCIFNYIVWLAKVLLNCDKKKKSSIIDSFLERTNYNDYAEDLLLCLIDEGEGKEKDFWEVWECLKPAMLQLGAKKQQYRSAQDFPFGRDKLIISYLFGNTLWGEDARSCSLLKEDRSAFFDDFIEKSENAKAVFYAVAKLLYTVGQDCYMDHGIEWLYELVKKDPECEIVFYDNTLFYMEEYIGQYIDSRKKKIRADKRIAREVQDVLIYMVNQQSQIAFFLLEENF